MTRIDLTRRNSNHPDRRRRYPSRARCDVAGRQYETTGPAPIYKLATLLWLHGHGGEDFEVWDDRDPFGKPGGLAMHGNVRNRARLAEGKLSFDRQAAAAADFTPDERDLIAQAAGVATDLMGGAPLSVGEAHTARSHLSGGPEHPQELDDASARLSSAHTPEAA